MKPANWYDITGPSLEEFNKWAEQLGVQGDSRDAAMHRVRVQRQKELGDELIAIIGNFAYHVLDMTSCTEEAIEMAWWLEAYKHRKRIARLCRHGYLSLDSTSQSERDAMNTIDRWE